MYVWLPFDHLLNPYLWVGIAVGAAVTALVFKLRKPPLYLLMERAAREAYASLGEQGAVQEFSRLVNEARLEYALQAQMDADKEARQE